MRRAASALACFAVLACNSGGESDGDEIVDESESETESDGETESEGTSETDSSGCEVAVDCASAEACVAGECVPIPEVAACEPPALVALPLPAIAGETNAIDVYDLDHDGRDEIIAWIDGSGVAVLDDGQWTVSDHVDAITASASVTVVDVDGDLLLDVLLTDGDNEMVPGLGDGTGSFVFENPFSGLRKPLGIEPAPDQRWAFGLRYLQSRDKPSYLRFDGDLPEVVPFELEPLAGWDVIPLEFDAEHEGVAFIEVDDCAAWPTRTNVDDPVHVIEMTELQLDGSAGFCSWVNADLDGDAREELVAFQTIFDGPPPYTTVVRALQNQTEAGAGPSFAAPQMASIPNTHPYAVAADLDGDGDDEILFSPHESLDAGASLVWASDRQLAGCLADVPAFPITNVRGLRSGDLDGDGDDEIVMFDADGELYSFDVAN